MKKYQSTEIAAAMRAARSEPSSDLVALIKKWGPDNHYVGDVLKFVVRYDHGGTWYTYLYLKTQRGWATTAKTNGASFCTWDQLVAKAVEHNLAPTDCSVVEMWRSAA